MICFCDFEIICVFFFIYCDDLVIKLVYEGCIGDLVKFKEFIILFLF